MIRTTHLLKIPSAAPSLREFLLRREVLGLYRGLMKAINILEDAIYKQQLKEWVREEFKSKKDLKDEISIRMELKRAQLSLREISSAINLSR